MFLGTEDPAYQIAPTIVQIHVHVPRKVYHVWEKVPLPSPVGLSEGRKIVLCSRSTAMWCFTVFLITQWGGPYPPTPMWWVRASNATRQYSNSIEESLAWALDWGGCSFFFATLSRFKKSTHTTLVHNSEPVISKLKFRFASLLSRKLRLKSTNCN